MIDMDVLSLGIWKFKFQLCLKTVDGKWADQRNHPQSFSGEIEGGLINGNFGNRFLTANDVSIWTVTFHKIFSSQSFCG